MDKRINWDEKIFVKEWEDWVQRHPEIPKEEELKRKRTQEKLDTLVCVPIDKDPTDAVLL